MGWEIEVIDNCNHKETQFVCLRRENIDYILGRECIKYHKNNNKNNDNESVLVDIYSLKDTFISKKLLVCKVINNGTLTCHIKNNLQSVICDMECVSKDEYKIEKYVLRVTDSLNILIADEKYNIKIYYIDEKKLKENSLNIDNSSLSKGVSVSIDDFFKKNNNKESISNSKKDKQNLDHKYNDVSIGKNILEEQLHPPEIIEENSSNKKSLNHDLDSFKKMINVNDDDIKPVIKEEVKKIKRDTTKSSEKRQEKEQKEKSLATTLFNIKKTNESSSSQGQHDSIIEGISINTKSFKINDKSEKLKLNKEIENSNIHKTNYKKFKRRNGSMLKQEFVDNNENNLKKLKVSMTKYVDPNIPKFKTLKDLKIDINNKKKDSNYNKCLFLDD